MDLKQFHKLYNFRQRSQEELSVLKNQIEDQRSSRSCSSSSSSSSASSSRSSSSSSSSGDRSLPYSRNSSENRFSDSEDEKLTKGRRKRRYFQRRSRDSKRTKRSSSESSSSSRSSSRESYYSYCALKYKYTVLITQLSAKTTTKDIQDFFSQAGKIDFVRLDFNPTTLEFEKSAFVQYTNSECVLLALALNGKKCLGTPVVVQPSQRDQVLRYEEKERRMRRPVRIKIKGLNSNGIEKSVFPSSADINEEEGFATMTFNNLQEAFKLCHELRHSKLSKSDNLEVILK